MPRASEGQRRPRLMPARKRQLLLATLRDAIIKGKYARGARLPTRRELERRFQASAITVQTALDQLRRDGFVHADGRHGTFVAVRLPCDTDYALAFPHLDRPDATWSLFYRTLSLEAKRVEQATDYRFPVYAGVGEEPEDNSARRRLVADAKAQRLAGIILPHPPAFLADTELMRDSDIAKVGIGYGPPGLPCIRLDMSALINRALDMLHRQRRRRIAVLLPAIEHDPVDQLERLNSILAQRRQTIPPYWKLQAPVNPASAARDIVHLLMSAPPAARPDGLLITDDNLLDAVCGGLMAAGVFGDEKLTVIAHDNFAADRPRFRPIHRIGFDPRVILDACRSIIDRQRRSKTPVPGAVIAPICEPDEDNN